MFRPSLSVKPTQAIQELLNEAALQAWVKQGIPLHKDKRETCAFCRQNLPHDIWQVLDSHFSRESTDLEAAIDDCLTSISTELQAIPQFLTLTADQFYAEEKASFEAAKETLNGCLNFYKQDLEAIKVALENRKATLFKSVPMPSLHHDSTAIQKCVDAITTLVIKNNERTNSLERDKEKARESLRLNDVATFISSLGYDAELSRIAGLKEEAEKAEAA